MTRRRALFSVVLVFIAFAAFVTSQPTTAKLVVAHCTDCDDAPIVLDQAATAELLRWYCGFRNIAPQSKIIPYALFTIDGVTVQCIDDGLERLDYPVTRMVSIWKFPPGELAQKHTRSSNNSDKLVALVNALRGKDVRSRP